MNRCSDRARLDLCNISQLSVVTRPIRFRLQFRCSGKAADWIPPNNRSGLGPCFKTAVMSSIGLGRTSKGCVPATTKLPVPDGKGELHR